MKTMQANLIRMKMRLNKICLLASAALKSKKEETGLGLYAGLELELAVIPQLLGLSEGSIGFGCLALMHQEQHLCCTRQQHRLDLA
jgi:hypothetical protein